MIKNVTSGWRASLKKLPFGYAFPVANNTDQKSLKKLTRSSLPL